MMSAHKAWCKRWWAEAAERRAAAARAREAERAAKERRWSERKAAAVQAVRDGWAIARGLEPPPGVVDKDRTRCRAQRGLTHHQCTNPRTKRGELCVDCSERKRRFKEEKERRKEARWAMCTHTHTYKRTHGTQSLTHSLIHLRTHSLTPSLTRTHTPSLPHSLRQKKGCRRKGARWRCAHTHVQTHARALTRPPYACACREGASRATAAEVRGAAQDADWHGTVADATWPLTSRKAPACLAGCTVTHSITELTPSCTHALTHSTHSLTHSLTHSPTHSLTPSLTHSLTHSHSPAHVRSRRTASTWPSAI